MDQKFGTATPLLIFGFWVEKMIRIATVRNLISGHVCTNRRIANNPFGVIEFCVFRM